MKLQREEKVVDEQEFFNDLDGSDEAGVDEGGRSHWGVHGSSSNVRQGSSSIGRR